MIKIIIILLLCITLCLSCSSNELPGQIYRHYSQYPEEELVKLYLGTETTGNPVLEMQGSLENESEHYLTDICLQQGTYTLKMIDDSGDGWGYTGQPSFIVIYIVGIEVVRGTIPFVDWSSEYPETTITFSTTLTLPFGSTWKYTDSSIVDSTWKENNYNDNSWSTASGDSFPSFTKTTRYYRLSVSKYDLSTLTSIALCIRTTEGYILYVNGKEIYRHNLPAGTISSTTLCLQSSDTSVIYRTSNIEKNIFSTTSENVLIAIEIHQNNVDGTFNDIFDFGGKTLGSSEIGTCSSNQFIAGTATSPDTQQVYYRNPMSCFDENTSTYFQLYSKTTTELTYMLRSNYISNINKYTVRSPPSATYGTPMSWKVYGSIDNDNWTLLQYVENSNFGGFGVTKEYSIVGNQQTFKYYKFEILSSSLTSDLCVFDIQGFSCNYESVSEEITYEKNEYTYYAFIDEVNIRPSTSLYHNFSITPSLPNGLTLSSETGLITGISKESLNGQYTITAFHQSSNTQSTTTITLIFNSCVLPNNYHIRFRKVNELSANEESFVIKNISGDTIFTSPKFVSYQDYSISMCLPSSPITIVVADRYDDGWANNAFLYIEVFDGYTNYYPVGIVTSMSKGQREFTFDPVVTISPKSSQWKYIQGNVPSNWYESSTINQSIWMDYNFNNPIVATSNIWLFSHSFSLTNKDPFIGFEIRLLAYNGYVIYVNGNEVTRNNINNGLITTQSLPTTNNDSAEYYIISISDTFVNVGNNIISIGIVNINTVITQNIVFECTLTPIQNSIFGRNWSIDILSNPIGTNIKYISDMSLKTYFSCTVEKTQIVYVIFDYGIYRREHMNKYCVGSNNKLSDYDPSDWIVHGSQDNNNWISLGNVTNAYFSSRSIQRCFYLPENKETYRYYRFGFTEPAVKYNQYTYYIGEITLLMADLDLLVIPPLALQSSDYISYVNMPFTESSATSELWNTFTIEPLLNLPLELDTSTGSIRGIPTKSMKKTQYKLTGKDPLGSIQTVLFNVTIDYCSYPNILFTLFIHSGSYSNTKTVKLIDNDNKVIYTQVGYVDNSDFTIPFCALPNVYTLTISSSGNSGWTDGYFKIYLEDETIVQKGTLLSNLYDTTYSVPIGYIITSKHTMWKYFDSNTIDISSDWYQLAFDDTQWKESTTYDLKDSISNTQYFRRRITINDVNKYSSINFRIDTRYGFIAYINGKEIMRYNIEETTSLNKNTNCVHINEKMIPMGSGIPMISDILHNGDNIFAIEVHRSTTSTNVDISFDASMYAVTDNSYRLIDGEGSSNKLIDTEISKLFDNTSKSIYISSSSCVGTTLIWTFNNNQREYITSYSITTGPNCNRRHPSEWKIEGSNDSGKTWILLHHIKGVQFTSYTQTKQYDFYNDKHYNQIRFVSQQCTNIIIDDATSNKENNCYLDGLEQGFQLSDLSYFSKRVQVSCVSTSDGFSGALDQTYAYKLCPLYYSGIIERLCVNGELTDENNECHLLPPSFIKYEKPGYIFYTGDKIDIVPIVDAAIYTCIIQPDLPQGLVFDKNSGRISGEIKTVMDNTYNITCSNSPQKVETSIHISSLKNDNTLMIVLIVVLVIVVIVVVFIVIMCSVKRCKSKKYKTHKVLENSTKKEVKQTKVVKI